MGVKSVSDVWQEGCLFFATAERPTVGPAQIPAAAVGAWRSFGLMAWSGAGMQGSVSTPGDPREDQVTPR